jgi:hypothetical protein
MRLRRVHTGLRTPSGCRARQRMPHDMRGLQPVIRPLPGRWPGAVRRRPPPGRGHDRGRCPLYVRAQPETADSLGRSGTTMGPKQQPATPGKPSSRAVFAGGGRCWVRTNVGLADGFTDVCRHAFDLRECTSRTIFPHILRSQSATPCGVAEHSQLENPCAGVNCRGAVLSAGMGTGLEPVPAARQCRPP